VIAVTNKLKVYEIDGVEVSPSGTVEISVVSHWNRDSLVQIVIDGRRLTVVAADLCAAIANATNTARHR
jgi:hypothetical protein